MSQRATKIECDWEKLSILATTTERIVFKDTDGLKALYGFLASIELQHPRKKALTQKRQELRASNSPSANRLRRRLGLARR